MTASRRPLLQKGYWAIYVVITHCYADVNLYSIPPSIISAMSLPCGVIDLFAVSTHNNPGCYSLFSLHPFRDYQYKLAASFYHHKGFKLANTPTSCTTLPVLLDAPIGADIYNTKNYNNQEFSRRGLVTTLRESFFGKLLCYFEILIKSNNWI